MTHQQTATSDTSIVVVDDTPDNLRLLAGLLAGRGYRIRPAASGPHALAAAREELPDLILLDIRMPEMDGYEVCKRLKADERTRDIPIIFISALHEAFDKVKAFALGGVDYITKPFQAEREADIFLESFTELQIYINLGLIDMTAYRKEVLTE